MKFANYEDATLQEKTLILMVCRGEAVPAVVKIPKHDGGVTLKTIYHVGHKKEKEKERPRLLHDMTVAELMDIRAISRDSLDRLIRSGRCTEEALERRNRIEKKLELLEKIIEWKRISAPKGE